jgi:putative DNA primase/helicase
MERLIPVAEIAGRLATLIDLLVPELLLRAQRRGRFWRFVLLDRDPFYSLRIYRLGPRAGRWVDGGTGQYGDPLDLVNAVLFSDEDPKAATQWAAKWLALHPTGPQPSSSFAARTGLSRRAENKFASDIAWEIGRASDDIDGTLAERYLRARGNFAELPTRLRYCPSIKHAPSRTKLPALLAEITNADDKITAVRLIYLRPDGCGKALVTEPEITLGRMCKGSCRLARADCELGLAEGLETALSAQILFSIPVWAACGSRMETIAVPDEVKKLTIFAHNSPAGRRAADRAAKAHRSTGREIVVINPRQPFEDFNDVVRAHEISGRL